MKEIRRVKASYFSVKAAKISKSGGVYKVLSARNKDDGGLKFLDPDTDKPVAEDSKLCEIFLNKFKTSRLINITLRRLTWMKLIRSSGTISKPIIGMSECSLNNIFCML